jgi:hypothetical protein
VAPRRKGISPDGTQRAALASGFSVSAHPMDGARESAAEPESWNPTSLRAEAQEHITTSALPLVVIVVGAYLEKKGTPQPLVTAL